MNTETRTDELSDELLDAEIPCDGIINPDIKQSCSRPAVLRTTNHGHGCGVKCIACWKIWYVHILSELLRCGYIRCLECNRKFISIESFSDFRPF